MKTPKRFICPVKDVPCGREKPCFPWAERGYADRNDCARWKRKNREAQLKHTIARLQQQVRHLKRRRHQALLIIDRERAAKNYALMMSGFYDKMDKLEGDFILAQTYGHDIEGS